MRKKFFCVGYQGHKKAESTVAMRKEFFCVGNYGHKTAEGTVAMRNSVLLCRQLRSHEG